MSNTHVTATRLTGARAPALPGTGAARSGPRPAPPDPLGRRAGAVRRFQHLLAGMGVVWLAAEGAALAGLCPSPGLLAFINPHFYALAMLGAVVLHLSSRPAPMEMILTLALGAAVAFGLHLLSPWRGHPTPAGVDGCLGLGVASLAVLGWRAGRFTGTARQDVLLLLLPAALLSGLAVLGPFCLRVNKMANPTSLDALVFAADGALGLQPSCTVGQWFAAVPVLARVTLAFYNTIALAFVCLYLVEMRAAQPPDVDVIPTLLIAAVGGFVIYLWFPVIGPAYTLGTHFPHTPPTIASVLAAGLPVPDEPRNCMPSLHTAWVLLLWWHARPLGRWVRVVAGLYVVGTLLATLGFGYHYFFDLVVAFPFALAVQAVCRPSLPLWGRRGGALAAGVVLAGGWMLVLRHGLTLLAWSHTATAGAALGTMAVTLLLERRLSRTGPDFPDLPVALSPTTW